MGVAIQRHVSQGCLKQLLPFKITGCCLSTMRSFYAHRRANASLRPKRDTHRFQERSEPSCRLPIRSDVAALLPDNGLDKAADRFTSVAADGASMFGDLDCFC